MQHECELNGALRIEHELRPRGGDTVVRDPEQHLLAHQVDEVSAFQPCLGRQRVSTGQRLNASREARYKISWALGAAQRLAGDGLDGGERVLDAMVELFDEQTLQFLRPFSAADV